MPMENEPAGVVAEVATVRTTVLFGVDVVTANDTGLKLAAAPDGNPDAVIETVPFRLLVATARLYVTDPPLAVEALVGVAVTEMFAFVAPEPLAIGAKTARQRSRTRPTRWVIDNDFVMPGPASSRLRRLLRNYVFSDQLAA